MGYSAAATRRPSSASRLYVEHALRCTRWSRYLVNDVPLTLEMKAHRVEHVDLDPEAVDVLLELGRREQAPLPGPNEQNVW
jgi:hypothetical protein